MSDDRDFVLGFVAIGLWLRDEWRAHLIRQATWCASAIMSDRVDAAIFEDSMYDKSSSDMPAPRIRRRREPH